MLLIYGVRCIWLRWSRLIHKCRPNGAAETYRSQNPVSAMYAPTRWMAIHKRFGGLEPLMVRSIRVFVGLRAIAL